jgi:serine/threonine protein kinase
LIFLPLTTDVQTFFGKAEAFICDFGMSKVIEEVTEINASLTLTEGGSARWLAPELIEGKAPSKEADVYSFAMSILELMTGKHPYEECKRDAQVIRNIIVLSNLPTRPKNMAADAWLSDDLWDLMQRCWRRDASLRPSMLEVSRRIGEIERRYAVLTDRPLC